MTKLTAFLIVIIFILWTVIVDHYAFQTGRATERNNILQWFPVVGMEIGNKNLCIDGKLNVHEVAAMRHGMFKSKKVHLVK